MQDPGRDQLARGARAFGSHLLGALKRRALQIPDALGGEPLSLAAVPDGDHGTRGEELIGHPLHVSRGRTVPAQPRNRLDHVAPVEVGGRRRHRTVYLPSRDRAGIGVGRGFPPPSRLPRGLKRALDRLAVEADLLRSGPPALVQGLRRDLALLGPARRQGRDFAGAARGVRPARRLEDFRPPGGERAQVGVGEALDLGDALADLLPFDAEALGQLVAQVRLIDVAGGFQVVVDRPGGRGGSNGRPDPGSRWRRGHGCAAAGRRFARSGGRSRRRGSRCP